MEELTNTQKVIILLIVGIPLIIIVGMILFIGSVEAEEIKTLYGNTSKIGGVTFNNVNNPIWIYSNNDYNKTINVTIGFYYDEYTEKPFNIGDTITVDLKACMTAQTIASVVSSYNNQIDLIYNTNNNCQFTSWSGKLYEILMTLKIDNVYYDAIEIDDVTTITAWYVVISSPQLYMYNGNNFNVSVIWKQFDYMKKSDYDNYIANLRSIGVQNEILTINNTINSSINNTTTAVNGTTQAINDMANEDLDNNTKQQVDTTDIADYNQKESALMTIANQGSLNGVQVGFDTNTSGTIWTLITRLLNTNSRIMALFISILSIGVIKLILAR